MQSILIVRLVYLELFDKYQEIGARNEQYRIVQFYCHHLSCRIIFI
jgi:hypothetical protein